MSSVRAVLWAGQRAVTAGLWQGGEREEAAREDSIMLGVVLAVVALLVWVLYQNRKPRNCPPGE